MRIGSASIGSLLLLIVGCSSSSVTSSTTRPNAANAGGATSTGQATGGTPASSSGGNSSVGATTGTTGGTDTGGPPGTRPTATGGEANGGATQTGTPGTNGGATQTGTNSGATQVGGAQASGGATQNGGARQSGGTGTNGGATDAGGATQTGGATHTGGTSSAGGTQANSDASAAGGTQANGGAMDTTNGTLVAIGGTEPAGGAMATGGSMPVGGAPTGGAAPSGGMPATGGTTAAAGWTCDAARYAAGNGCDCGCGVKDPDCPDSLATSCANWNLPGGCDTALVNDADYNPYNYAAGYLINWADNAVCVGPIPSTWTCPPNDYGDTAYCDCGCGAKDADCPDGYSAIDCSDADEPGACTVSLVNNTAYNPHNFSAMDLIVDQNPALCIAPVPSSWTCAPNYYKDGQYCDCGCGVVDPDCPDTSAYSCGPADDTGSCTLAIIKNVNYNPAGGGANGLISAWNNAGCTSPVPATWTCAPNWYADGYCDGNCGAPDPDCG